jgi:hypothetical protein
MSVSNIKPLSGEFERTHSIINPTFSERAWSGEYPAPGGWVVTEKHKNSVIWNYFPESGEGKREIGDYVFGDGEGTVPYQNRKATAVLERIRDEKNTDGETETNTESDEECSIELRINDEVVRVFDDQPSDTVELEEWWINVIVEMIEYV